MRRIQAVLFFALCFSSAAAQLMNGPVIRERFEQNFLTENFDSISPAWPVASTAENLLLIQDGELIIQRKSATGPFAVMGSIENSLTAYRLVTSLNLVKAGPQGELGFIFMAQQGGKGGFLFELNAKQQYRVRQLSGASYKFITGEARTDGWLKSTTVNQPGQPNILEIRTSNRKYDILLNNHYLVSFSEMAYRSGGFGYYAGPQTKGTVDFLYIFSDDITNDNNQLIASATDSLDNQDIEVLAAALVKMKSQVAKLTAENNEFRELLRLQRAENSEVSEDVVHLKEEVEQLQVSAAQLRQSNDSLLKVNEELKKYKTAVEGQGDGEVVLTLSKSLKTEKQKNEALKQENATLREQLKKLQSPVLK